MSNLSFKLLLISLMILSTFSATCEKDWNNRTKTEEECFRNSGIGKYSDHCCHYKEKYPNANESNLCITVPYSSYTGNGSYYINDILYDVKCSYDEKNEKEITALERCGNTHDTKFSLKRCKKYSSFVDSCCYHEKEGDQDSLGSGCFWLGTKYEGSITWANIKLKCSDSYLKYSLFYAILLFMLVIFA